MLILQHSCRAGSKIFYSCLTLLTLTFSHVTILVFFFFHQHLGFPIIGLEADLKDAIAEGVAVQGLDGDQALVVVGHGDEPEAFALVGLQVADHFDVLHGTKWAK